ncbi:hypothetical protein N8878_08390 [Psychromonas sp.]|nr:hypothetical protein [Psychromonas sp.]
MRLELNLENVLSEIDSFDWHLDAYIFSNEPICMSSLILIIDDDEEDERDENDEPLYPASKGYKSFLSVADLQSIKGNLLDQNSSYSQSELLNAVKYYHENDAFLLFNS